jgi:thiamine-phosphate diphosphorylase
MLELPPLYPITDASQEMPLSGQVARFAKAGFPLVQFRGKPLGAGEQWRELRAALAAAAEDGGWPLIVVNDRADLAVLAVTEGLAPWGLHLGQTDLPASAAARLPGLSDLDGLDGLHIGASTHNDREWQSVDPACDHAGVGPFRATSTKRGHDPAIGLEGLQRGCAALSSRGIAPIAIGGLTIDDAPTCFGAGASSVAMSKDLAASGPHGDKTRLADCLWQAQKAKYSQNGRLGKNVGKDICKNGGVAIVGGSGAGKTALAAAVARRLGLGAVDLDARIAERAGRPIAEIFGGGEAEFRAIEAECLPECLGRPAVLALGAGAWQQEAVRRLVAKSGWDVLWLAEDPKIAWGRVGGDPARPLASDRAEFMRRWRSRTAYWSMLPPVLPLGRSPDELAETLAP